MMRRILALTLILTGCLGASASARTLDFYFTLTNTIGTTTGTVTGELIGLTDNDASTLPTGIIITSAPADYGLPSNYDFGSLVGESGSFSVLDGQITGIASFSAADSTTTHGLFLNFSGINQFNGTTLTTANSSGFSSADYVPVPEPVGYGLLLFLATAGFCVWKRRDFNLV